MKMINNQFLTIKMQFYLFFNLCVILLLNNCDALAKNVPMPAKLEFGANSLVKRLTIGTSKGSGLRWLEHLVDDFGHRHLCSRQLEDAIDFTVKRLREDGFDCAHTENVPDLPRWTRGQDMAAMIEPRPLQLNILAIMGSASAEVKAPVVVVTDIDQLQATNVSGKIVVFAEKWKGYGGTVSYRTQSAKMVERMGGVGVLIKSVAPFSLGTTHTGFGEDANIPAACIPLEEAELLERLYKRGKQIVVRMDIKSKSAGTCTSRNTVFEIKGSEYPDEIVLMSAHMDSWDVGQGAMDDGGGMAAVWQAMEAIREMAKKDPKLGPKRTIRAVFWTAEEQGHLGAQVYFQAHRDTRKKFVFVSETDEGAFRPNSFKSELKFSGTERQFAKMEKIVSMLNSAGVPLSLINSSTGSQGDVTFWANLGVPAANYVSERGIDYYFQFHHTNADYLNIFKEEDIDYTASIFGVLAYTIANLSDWA